MLKVIDTNNFNRVIGKVDTYAEAWDVIYEQEMNSSNCICKNTKEQWEEWESVDEIYPNFVWPENVDYVWTAEWIAEPILDPVEYNEESVIGLIDDLMLHYKIEEV
jgi:hypothetical protein